MTNTSPDKEETAMHDGFSELTRAKIVLAAITVALCAVVMILPIPPLSLPVGSVSSPASTAPMPREPFTYFNQGLDGGVFVVNLSTVTANQGFSLDALASNPAYPTRWSNGLWRISDPNDPVQTYAQPRILGTRSVSIRLDPSPLTDKTVGSSSVEAYCSNDGTATVKNGSHGEVWKVTANADMTVGVSTRDRCRQAAELVAAMHGLAGTGTPFDFDEANRLVNQHPSADEWGDPYVTLLPSRVLAVGSDDYLSVSAEIASGKSVSSDLGHGFVMVTPGQTREGRGLTNDQIKRIVDARIAAAKSLVNGCRDD